VETPIYDPKAYSRIEYVFPESDKNGHRDLLKRMESTNEFLKYLEISENFDLNRPKQDDENDSLTIRITDKIGQDVKRSHDRMSKFLTKK